ncbi:solute carrier family 2, facilitated glucose transporter member 6-like, partial [Contarinia nasturtii]|uniref:solute carrier family 2, facilitated glucose transporter member 6-like n=1 Tax=Contarinia nasturtii TaxID=265458 RepID=UPI0012D413ED
MTFEKYEQNEKDDKHKYRYRRFIAQFLATTVKNMLLFDLGLCLAFPGIIIPALTGIQNEFNQNETLSLTASQVSWLGSVNYVVEPLGSILSAIITDPLGRRRAMMIVNIPLIIA